MVFEKTMENGNSGRQPPVKLTDFNSTTNLVDPDIKLYRRRWCILFFYSFLGAISGFQWTEMTIIEDALARYYEVDSIWIEWTATVWSFTCIFCAIPGAWLVERHGLRAVLVSCSFLNLFGTVLKAFSSERHRFPLAFVGNAVSSLCQAIALSLPPRIASLWFGSNEVATATSIGILGFLIGTAIGFFIPPFVVVATEDMHDMKAGLDYLNWTITGLSLLTFVFILIWFKDTPPTPPSIAAMKQIELISDDMSFHDSVNALIRNPNYWLLLLSYGINMGIYCAFSTLLNAFILPVFPTAQKDAGMIGLTYSITGMFGLITSGFMLDKTKKFKEVYLANFILATLSLFGFAFFIDYGSIISVYITAGIFGFFVAALMSLGYEVANELTYPIPESTANGIVVAASQICSVVAATTSAFLLPHIGVLGCLYIFTVLYGVGAVLVCLMPKTYLRQMANEISQTRGTVAHTGIENPQRIGDNKDCEKK